MHSQASSTATASSSPSSSTTTHAATAAITSVLSSLMHAATTASIRLVLDLLFLDNVDNLVGHSEVLDLQHVRVWRGAWMRVH
jgi:hypothetical protein